MSTTWGEGGHVIRVHFGKAYEAFVYSRYGLLIIWFFSAGLNNYY